MKNFTYKALAVATAAACGAGAHAGTATATASKYAVEAITSTTAVTLPTITYTMGVARASNQGFTIVVRQPAGSTTTLSCGSIPTVTTNAAGAAVVTVKRASTTECAYDVDVTTNSTNVAVGNQINFAGISINAHGLATVGATEKLNVALYDTGETARVDNSNDVQVTVATSGRAVSLVATQDTGTQADVNYNSGNSPLFGFVVANDDTATQAYANFNIVVDATNYVNASGSAALANTILTNVVVTVAGDFAGLNTTFSAGNSTVTASGNGGAVTPVVAYANSAATITLTGVQLTANGTTQVAVGLKTLATQSLGTSRTFSATGVANPSTAGVTAQTLAGNTSWWVWGANGIELRSAFFNNDTANGNLTRFFFQNTGTAATYSATCQAETGVTPTYGTAKTGTLVAGTTAVNASDICTFSTGKRGSITFTINSSAGKIKGVYQQAINGAAASYIALERPYAGGTY